MADWMIVLLPLLAVPIVLLFRFVGCKPFDEAPSFVLTLEPKGTTANRGQSASVTVTATSHANYTAATTLTARNVAGIVPLFSRNPVTPSPTAPAQSTLTLDVSGAAALGDHSIDVTGSDGASPTPTTATATLTLTVIAPVTPDFGLSLTPSSVTAARGQSRTLTVNINRVGGFAGAVALTSMPPTNIAPSPTTGNASTLTVLIPMNQPIGPVTLTVTGVSGALTRTASGTVNVTA